MSEPISIPENDLNTGLTIVTDEVSGPYDLNEESLALINQIINEKDLQRSQDLTQLFNANQNKKTLVRVNKLNALLDSMTEQAYTRFTSRPDEISNKELFDGLKVVQDLIERGQKQVSGVGETPLIQVNQQNNEVSIGGTASTLSRDSRERVKSAVLGLLSSLSTAETPKEPMPEEPTTSDNTPEELLPDEE